MCYTDTLPDFEKHMCADLRKQTCKNPDGLKHRCIEVLKAHIPNYSEELVESLTHRAVISNPDRLKQLCLQKLRILLPGYSDAEYETIRKTRKITPIPGINYPSSTDLTKYLHSLSLSRKACVMVPRLKREVVQLWTKTHWSQLDAYSDIEETGSELQVTPDDFSDDQLEVKYSHNLRPRKRHYNIDRSRRPSSKDKFYRGLCESPVRKR